ncbi:MAG TPA: hypothetical protein VGX03_38570 [Candidatus Binatia bacterium]|nr:hypothetical protein [Candidatus Binatia bacterium]
MSILRQPRARMKEIDPPSGWELREWFIRRDTEAMLAERGRKVSSRSQMQEHLQVIRAHAKQHGHRLVDRQIGEPIVVYAPGSQGGHGEAERRRELMAQIEQQAAVKGALRGFRVKVYLDGGNLGGTDQLGDRRNNLLLLVSGKLWRFHSIGFNTYNRHKRGTSRDAQGLQSRPHYHPFTAQVESAGEKGDPYHLRVNEIKIFPTLPCPQHNLR